MRMKQVFAVFAMLLLAVSAAAAEKKVVTYRDFGAKGDGKTNDLEAIFKAHEYANKHGLPVKADDNAVYLLEDGPAPVVIKTDVDWGKAKFIVNDLAENLPNFRKALFHVQSSRKEYDIKDLKPLKRGQKNVGIKLPGRAVILVVDKTTKRYIRYGANANKGSDQGETILVNKNGDIDPATPVIWDYKTISKATVFPVDEKLLTVKGGDFTTYTNNRKGKHVYFGRGIAVTRSNTLIQGVIHRVIEPEGIDSWPYTGFLNVGKCAEVTFKDCKVTGRKVYSYPIPGQKKRKTTGTYDISGNNAVKINYINVVQINDFMDPVYWGVMGTNFCKSVLLDGCKVSRFDAHQGVTNAIIRNSQLGYQGINAIGFGTFLVENSISYGSRLINFRADYGAMWNGDFIIRNCKFVPGNAYNLCLFGGPATPQHDFGYPCMMPETITIDGLEVDMSKVKRSKFLAVFGDFDRQNKNPESKQPYTFTKTLNVKNLTCNGLVKLAHKPEQFKKMKVNGKLPK